MFPSRRWAKSLLAAAACAAACHARPAQAVSGTSVSSSGNGLTLSIDTQWVDGGGYRPVQVAILPAAPTATDQTLHIEFHAKQYIYPRAREIAVGQDIAIPAGTSGVIETIAVPQLFPFQSCSTEVWVNGRYSSALKLPAFAGGAGPTAAEGLPNIMLVGGPASLTLGGPAGAAVLKRVPLLGAPDASTLRAILPQQYIQQPYGVVTTVTPAGAAPAAPPLPTLIAVPYNGLPRRWIELSGLDIICISLGNLEQLSAAEPERWQALRHWTAAGGNLIVFDAGARLERIDAITKCLAPGKVSAGPASQDWAKPDPADFGDSLKTATSFANQFTAPIPPLNLPAEPPFLLRRFSAGMVLAAETDDLFKQPSQHWVWMLNALGSNRWLWHQRHGLSLERKNTDFWNWLVRGVGLAPVTEFRVLITLFVLAIGPVNYFWLRRRGSLHLLVIIVPLAAFAVTFALFGYALVADGLQTRVRARTWTRIDQRAGQAVCWSRISYYAGLAPSGGLVFPDDVVVLPLADNSDAGDVPRRRNVVWSAGKQKLVSGWLASRTPTQLVTVRSGASPAGLRFFPPRGKFGAQVGNHLGTRIVRLLLADEKGRHYRAADVADGVRAPLAAADPAKEEAAIYDLVSQRKPGLPEGFVAPGSYGFSGRRRYNSYSPVNNSLPAASQASGLLETGLREAVLGPGQNASWTKPAGFPLAPRSYLAIVERSPEVLFGVDEVSEEESLHVIVGTW